MDAWVERELAGGEFPDQRLKARLGKLLGDLGRRIGGTIPVACQDWAATKAAYRLFSNLPVQQLLSGANARRAGVFEPRDRAVVVITSGVGMS